jgi:hypothetical protein
VYYQRRKLRGKLRYFAADGVQRKEDRPVSTLVVLIHFAASNRPIFEPTAHGSTGFLLGWIKAEVLDWAKWRRGWLDWSGAAYQREHSIEPVFGNLARDLLRSRRACCAQGDAVPIRRRMRIQFEADLLAEINFRC